MRLLAFFVCAAAFAQPLQLKQVLDSTLNNYPPLLAALQDRVIADADFLTAEGRFDLNAKALYDADYFTKYPNQNYALGVDQATRFQGMSYFGGWRLGQGDYASYDGKRETDSAGEYSAGLRMPLLRDRSIDSRRADLYKAGLGRRVAGLGIEQQKLLIIQLATRRYWDWVAAGRRLEVARAILETALHRDQQLKDAFALGQIPRMDVTDNQQAILNRRQNAMAAERGLEQAAIELSLFYRDPSGNPQLPAAAQLPPQFPGIRDFDAIRLMDDIDLAIKRRPEIQRFSAQRDQVEFDRKLARNQLLPAVDLIVAYTREAGTRQVARGPDELGVTLNFDLPVQRRQAKGRESSALARIEQFDQRERFARDQVVAEVRDAYSALSQAYKQTQVLREQVEVARHLEEAERVRFELGEGTLFVVNLREQITAETALREISAVQDYFRALALYDFATARTP